MTDWCILRCRGSNTLRLARSLSDSGLEAWTPIEVQVCKPKGGKHVERIVAAATTYVFARAIHLHELFALSGRSASSHPDFSLFLFDGRIPLVDDRELYRMRQIERIAAAKAEPPVFTIGQDIRIPDGPYEGMTGRVIETKKGKWVLVAFPEHAIPVKFASWTLSEAA